MLESLKAQITYSKYTAFTLFSCINLFKHSSISFFPPNLWLQCAEASIVKEIMSTENWAVGLSTATSSFYSLKFTKTHTQTLQRVTKEHSLTATSATNPLKLRCCCYVYVHFSYLTPMEGVSVKCKWNRNKRCVTERAVQQICQSDYN